MFFKQDFERLKDMAAAPSKLCRSNSSHFPHVNQNPFFLKQWEIQTLDRANLHIAYLKKVWINPFFFLVLRNIFENLSYFYNIITAT